MSYRILVCLLISLFAILTGCVGEPSGASDARLETEPLKIGIIASLTGPAAEQGKNWLSGAELAVSEINGQENSGAYKVKLHIEDDQTQAAQVASAFQKLAQVNKVNAIIGGTWDYLAQVAYPLASQHRVPFLTPTNSVELMDKAALENQFVFSNAFSMAGFSRAVRGWLVAKEIKTIALVTADIPWGHAHAQAISALASELGIEVVLNESFSLQSYPEILKTLALRTSAAKPQAVLVTFNYNGIDVFAGELLRLGAAPIILDTQHIDTALKLSENSRTYRKIYGVYPLVMGEEFNDKYKAKHKVAPPVFAAHGYDAVKFLYHCHKEFKAAPRAASCEYAGITGVHRIKPETPALTDSETVVMTIENGVFERWVK